MKDQHGNPLPDPNKVGGFYLDRQNKRFFVFRKDILINQLKRDTPKIAESFDLLAEKVLEQVSTLFSQTYGLLAPHILGGDLESQSRAATCARLLNTAVTTFTACIHIARGGFRLQYMALSRSVIENIAIVLHIMTEPEALALYHKGDLKSTKSITVAGKVLPGFGRMWGTLSNDFVHISSMHSALNPLVKFRENDEALPTIKSTMKMLAWLLYVAAELVFAEDLPNARYWKIIHSNEVGNFIAFDPSEEEKQWQQEFFGECDTGSA